MTTPTIRLSSPADLVALAPNLIGFTPTDSIVILVLGDSGNHIEVTARIDMPPISLIDSQAASLTVHLRRAVPDLSAVALVGYTDQRADLDAYAAALTASLDAPIRALIQVSDGRWYSLDCAKPCCPPEGTPLVEQADVVNIYQEATGRAPAASRAVLTERTAENTARSAQVDAMIAQQAGTPSIEDVADVWLRLLTSSDRPVTVAEGATMLGGFTVQVRDMLLNSGLTPNNSTSLWRDDAVMELAFKRTVVGPTIRARYALVRNRLMDLCQLASTVETRQHLLAAASVLAWFDNEGAMANDLVDLAGGRNTDGTGNALAHLTSQFLSVPMAPPGIGNA